MDIYWLINFGTFPNNQDNGNVTIAVVHAGKQKQCGLLDYVCVVRTVYA